jgi:hypothetical protein
MLGMQSSSTKRTDHFFEALSDRTIRRKQLARMNRTQTLRTICGWLASVVFLIGAAQITYDKLLDLDLSSGAIVNMIIALTLMLVLQSHAYRHNMLRFAEHLSQDRDEEC